MGRSSADQRDLLPKQVDPTSHWYQSRPSRLFHAKSGLVCFVGGAHGPYKDNLCFFSRTPGAPDVKTFGVPSNTHYHQYLQYRKMTSNDLQGVYLDDLIVSEQLFSLNVYVYDLQGMEEGDIAARLGRCSPYS